MLRNLRQFFREYKQFGLVLIAFAVGIGLDMFGYDTAAHWLLGITAISNVMPLLWGMYQDLKSGKYGIDILAATAIITSVILGEYIAGMIIVLMLTGGEALEDYAENRAKVELHALLDRAPKRAHVLRGRKETDIPIKLVSVGDKLIIKPGEVVPVDGIIVDGQTSIDESSLTGESLPLSKKMGDVLMSGAVNIDGVVTMRATETAANSQYEQIIKLVKSAASTESPFVRLADQYSIPFTILSFAIAGAVWIISGDPVRFLQVIVVATPCPLLIAAPIALISGMSRAAKQGIIVKSGSSLERLAQVRTMAFDKTGTLTQGKPEVQSVTAYGNYKKDEVLAVAAAAEVSSTHILARAIVDEAINKNLKLYKVKSLQELPGRGMNAHIGGKYTVLGTLNYLRDEGITLPPNFSGQSIKLTATYIGIDGKLAGIITFADAVRDESHGMLARLKKLGIRHTLMVTGDNQTVANSIAKKLGIDEVVADALPGDKVQAIEALKLRPVAFVGDGVNDAPVLTAADIGIALGARGSTAASESADVVIMLDNIDKVAQSVEIAKKTFSIAQQAILIGIGLSLAMQLVFATGRYAASLGAALQEIVDVVVIFIALRAHGSFRASKQAREKLDLKQA
ncbi:heavy metal translocating P-type ATPase [Candidatus Saccharibacteria bacterium]|nr:heavy metal translocating P-type ATPase [Candidatus Saccharibacteria bacterium]